MEHHIDDAPVCARDLSFSYRYKTQWTVHVLDLLHLMIREAITLKISLFFFFYKCDIGGGGCLSTFLISLLFVSRSPAARLEIPWKSLWTWH